MPLAVADRVRDTATTTGTGSFTLAGSAPTGYRTFAAALGASASFVPYLIVGRDAIANEWEVGLGTLSSSTTLARTTVTASSNSGSAVNFSAGTKDVMLVSPAALFTPATAAQYRANTANKLIETDSVWNAMAEVALTHASPTAWDMSAGFDFSWAISASVTLSNPTNTKVGQKGRLRIVQTGGTSRIVTWSSSYEFAGGTAPTLSTPQNSEDVLYYDVISSTRIFLSLAGKAIA